MEIILKRIKRDSYDELLAKVISDSVKNNSLTIDERLVESVSEVIVNGEEGYKINFDIEDYNGIVAKENKKYEKRAMIGQQLNKDLDKTGIPQNVLYEKEVWAWLSIVVFRKVVEAIWLGQDNINEEHIKREVFNCGNHIDRTGLFFVWSIINRLGSKDDYVFSKTAFEFIDPVKAIHERTMSKNPEVLRAFVQGILNNGKDSKFKNKEYRLKVPNHISCYARTNMLDAYTYEELVSFMTEEQKLILRI